MAVALYKLASCAECRAMFLVFTNQPSKMLLKRIDFNYTFVPNITSACCILQKFLESKNEQYNRRWLEDVAETEITFPQSHHFINREKDTLPGSDIRQH